MFSSNQHMKHSCAEESFLESTNPGLTILYKPKVNVWFTTHKIFLRENSKAKKKAVIKFKLLSVYIQLVLCKLNLTFYAIFLNGLNIEDYF